MIWFTYLLFADIKICFIVELFDHQIGITVQKVKKRIAF